MYIQLFCIDDEDIFTKLPTEPPGSQQHFVYNPATQVAVDKVLQTSCKMFSSDSILKVTNVKKGLQKHFG